MQVKLCRAQCICVSDWVHPRLGFQVSRPALPPPPTDGFGRNQPRTRPPAARLSAQGSRGTACTYVILIVPPQIMNIQSRNFLQTRSLGFEKLSAPTPLFLHSRCKLQILQDIVYSRWIQGRAESGMISSSILAKGYTLFRQKSLKRACSLGRVVRGYFCLKKPKYKHTSNKNYHISSSYPQSTLQLTHRSQLVASIQTTSLTQFKFEFFLPMAPPFVLVFEQVGPPSFH